MSISFSEQKRRIMHPIVLKRYCNDDILLGITERQAEVIQQAELIGGPTKHSRIPIGTINQTSISDAVTSLIRECNNKEEIQELTDVLEESVIKIGKELDALVLVKNEFNRQVHQIQQVIQTSTIESYLLVGRYSNGYTTSVIIMPVQINSLAIQKIIPSEKVQPINYPLMNLDRAGNGNTIILIKNDKIKPRRIKATSENTKKIQETVLKYYQLMWAPKIIVADIRGYNQARLIEDDDNGARAEVSSNGYFGVTVSMIPTPPIPKEKIILLNVESGWDYEYRHRISKAVKLIS